MMTSNHRVNPLDNNNEFISF